MALLAIRGWMEVRLDDNADIVGRRYFSLELMQGPKENVAEPELHLAVA